MRVERHFGHAVTVWMLWDIVCFGVGWYPLWETPHWYVKTNGGRWPQDCLDITGALHRMGWNLTFWRPPSRMERKAKRATAGH